MTLNYAARLHDVGMVAVDAELLRRDGPLTEAERRRVGMHTVIGEEMLRPYGLPVEGLKAIRHHHEHYDGGGSPDGLKGDAIPLLARIITVVDVYDALTSERVYRGAMNHEQAAQELRSMAGCELDPVLVERFLALHDI
ncbi:MAG: metal dependent phosphohydrolase with sensor [Symbiobacteriaceae bacterium]|nr:metal dependent phosphohydrolase with sensor [Symbiobacteriaceae bacterium]